MYQTFEDCDSIVEASNIIIPNGVTNMDNTFRNCTSLTTAPTIPNSVTNMTSTFAYCVVLSGTIEIPVACQGQNIGYSNVIYK